MLPGPFGLVKFWYVSAGELGFVSAWQCSLRCVFILVRQARWVQLGNVPLRLRYGRYGELSWVQLGYVKVRWGMAGAVRLGISFCVAIWCVESMYVELRSVAVRYGRQGGLRYCTVGSVWVRSGRRGGVRLGRPGGLWFGRLGEVRLV